MLLLAQIKNDKQAVRHNGASVRLSCLPSNPMSNPVLNPARTLCGMLALELSEIASDIRLLVRDEAGALAQCIARDLAGFDARLSELSLSTVGAHYDPIELLRPGWPLLAELDQLSARAPGQARAQIIAFAAHDGLLPGQLMPANEYLGGPLRVIPFVLHGNADTVTEVSAHLEHDLVEHSMAGAETALTAQAAFALNIEHARYLTLHDLCAMTALQYEHAGLAALWPLIETALFSPEREFWLDAPPEPLVLWRKGQAQMAEFDDDKWQQRYAPGLNTVETARLKTHFQARQSQFVSILGAHAIKVDRVPYSKLAWPAITLFNTAYAERSPNASPPRGLPGRDWSFQA